MKIFYFSVILFYFALVSNVNCLFKKVLSHFYCHNESCYEILGISEKATPEEIRYSYYKKLKNIKKGYDLKKKKKVVRAFNILINKRTRSYYDYYLNNPNSIVNLIYFNLYCFYKLFKVILILLLVSFFICLFQYIHNSNEMKRVIQKCSKNKLFKREVQNRIAENHPDFHNYDLKKKRKIEKKIEEDVVQEIVMINNQKTRRLGISDLIIVKIFFLPRHIWQYVKWNIKWIIKYNILNEEYDENDKVYITRKYMNVSLEKWNSLNEEEKRNYLKKELWVKQNLDDFLHEEREKDRINKISSSKYKKQIRMKKKGISFNYND
ncbi:DnaJ protein, putative [Plasmodium relictum]|uniref:DnaJ protein, putative n=1 Tax=Plasmodium relictum TaxID=85471 RepID=A0A1J1H9N5_PLARL|nr:DnaJ protein, putative [Plasmodium relictum]CRH00303.1 DnaJ protein, putative [Plasmodium relictum]